jgi:hypothetical protein
MQTSRLWLVLVLCPCVVFAAPCPELPTLFIVQDKSGSMAGPPDPLNAPNAASKWSTARAVVPLVASQFSDRFRFGVMMFPAASTSFACSQGTVTATVPSTAADVQATYNANVAGGGTPSAASLTAAKAYLQSLGGASTKYVLLITDGLPNCNSAANANTCQTTTPGCQNLSTCSGSTCCGLGAKDCLDDSPTVAAAAALKAAGIKVYVVGFGTSVTLGNNKAVLDAVASAGGTGSAYVANDQASLTAALNQVAFNAATCCIDACAAGAAQCLGSGGRQVCQLNAQTGCTTWNTQSCQAMSACSGGTCVACTNTCTAGAQRCNGNSTETCQVGAAGCTAWVPTRDCNYGELCSGGQCNTCQACSIGSGRCTAAGAETCDWNVLSGCTQWKVSTCAAGTRCSGGSCQACNGTCTAGAQRCSGKTVESCVADAAGCTAWQSAQTCATFCSGGVCGMCGPACAPGATRCNGNGVETCGTDTNGCTAFAPAAACGAGQFCTNGSCNGCPSSCTPGTRRCGASGGVEQCAPQSNGCSAWLPAGTCAAGERCEGGTCIPPCTDECTAGAAQCAANTPVQCVKAATGCTVWQAQPACATDTVCVGGGCRERCPPSELQSCSGGLVCTGLPEGMYCLPPDGTGGGSAGGGAPTGGGAASGSGGGSGSGAPPLTTEEPGSKTIGATSAGCGCTSGSEALAPLLLGAWAARRRARRERSTMDPC